MTDKMKSTGSALPTVRKCLERLKLINTLNSSSK